MATKEPTQKAKLALTLWDTREAFWNDCKEWYKEENSNVTTKVIETPVNANHGGYEEDGGEPVLQ